MSGLPKQIVQWQLNGGLATKTSPFAVQPGSFLTLDNVRQERRNEWRPRPALAHDTRNDLSDGSAMVRAIGLPGGGALGMTSYVSAQPQPSTTIFTPSTSSTAFWLRSAVANSAQSTPKVWSRRFVGTAVNSPSGVSRAASDSIALTAWWSSVDNLSHLSIASLAEGDSLTFGGDDTNWIGTTNQPVRPRCSFNSNAGLLMVVWVELTTGNVKAASFNATTGAINTVATVIGAGAHATDPYIDAWWYGGATTTVVYRTAGSQIRFLEVNPNTMATPTSAAVAVNCNTCLALLQDPDASGTRFVATYDTAGAALRILRCTSAGAVSTNDPIAEATSVEQVAGVAYQAGAGWMVVYETAAALKACKKRNAVVGATATISGYTAGRYSLATGAYRTSGQDTMRYVVRYRGAEGGGGVGGSFADLQRTYYELALEYENGAGTIGNSFPEAQARMLPYDASGNLANASLAHVMLADSGRVYETALARLFHFDVAAGVEKDKWAIDRWRAAYMNTSNAATLNVGEGVATGSTAYLPDGLLLQSGCGDIVCGHGASTIPIIGSLTAAAGGGLTASSSYQYLATVDMWDDAGNRWVGPPSTSQIVALAAGQTKVTVVVWCGEFENRIRKRTVKIWRTQSNGSQFRLLYSATDVCPNNVQVTFADTIADTAMVTSELLPADLTADLTPAFSHVALFGNRMWGTDRDFPQNLYFSKPLEQGRAPEFPAEFVVNIEDVTGDPTLLLPMDDKLVSWKRNAIYVVTGDGPDNTGAGQFPTVTRIESDVGSITPHGVSTGGEVFWCSQRGLHRMNRSLEIDWFEQLDRFFNQPQIQDPETVIGAVFNAQDSEVRFLTGNYRFVFDRESQVWIRDTGALASSVITRALAGAAVQSGFSDPVQMLFRSNGEAWNDRPDALTPNGLIDIATPYVGTIRSPWIGAVEGWMRFYRGRVVGWRTLDVGAVLRPTMTVYFDNDDTISETSTGTINAGAPLLLRGEMRTRRQKCSRFSIGVSLVTDASLRLEGFAAVVAPKQGSQPLPQNDRWA